MGKAQRVRTTPALRLLSNSAAEFSVHTYEYVDRGGTRASARALGVEEHCIIKTLIFEDDRRNPFIVLMHGNLSVSAKALARIMGAKRVAPCSPDVAQKHSGYRVGGTSPFGTKKSMAVYMESSIAGLDRIYINGGARGLLVSMEPTQLQRLIQPTLVQASTEK